MKIFIYDESRALIRTVGTPDVMQGENNATLIFMSVAGIDESNFHDYLAQFAATIGTSRPADVITDFGTYVLDGVTYHGWKYLVSSKFTQVAGVLNANLVLSSGGSTLISQTVSLNVNPSASGVTWFKNITQAQWGQLLAYCVGLRNPNLGVLPDEGGLDAYCEAGQAGAYLYVDNGGVSHLLFVGYDEAQDRVCQTDYYNENGALLCRQRYTANGDWDAWGNWAVNSQASAISFDDSKSELLAGKNTVQKAIAWLGESFRPINFVPSLSANGFSVVDGLDPKDKKIKDADGNNLDATGIKEYSYRKFNGNQNAISTGKAVLFTDDGSIYELVVEETLVAYHFDGSPAELVAQAKSEQSAINQTLTDGVSANENLIKNSVVGNSAMTMDPTTYVITVTNTNLNGQVIGTYSVDIPAEMAFVSGRYDAEGRDLVFTLQNGNEVVVPVDDIFVGLATQDWVNAEIADALVPYATSSWVDSNYVSLTKGGYVSMAEAPASASAYYFGAKNGSTSFVRLADNSFDAKTTKGDVSMMFSLNYSSSNKARFVKIDSSTSPSTVSATDVPFKNGAHSLVLDDDLSETNTRVTSLESKTAKNESDIQYLYRQVIGGGDLVTTTDSGVALVSQTFPLTVSPKALLNYVGGMCQKVNQFADKSRYATKTESNVTFTPNGDGSITIVVGEGGASAEVTLDIDRQAYGSEATIGDKFALLTGINNSNIGFRDDYNGLELDGNIIWSNTYNNIWWKLKVNQGLQAGTYKVFPLIFNLTDIYGAGNEPTSTSDPRVQWLISYFTQHPEYDAGSIITAPVTKVVSKYANGDVVKEYPIPVEVQALDGYGLGIDDTYNYIDFERRKFVKNVTKTGNELLKLDTPVETDISEYLDRDLPDNDVIDVTAGGQLEFENVNDIGVPYSVTYQSKPETQGEGE